MAIDKKQFKKIRKTLSKLIDRLSEFEGDGGEVHKVIFGDRLNPENSLERYYEKKKNAS